MSRTFSFPSGATLFVLVLYYCMPWPLEGFSALRGPFWLLGSLHGGIEEATMQENEFAQTGSDKKNLHVLWSLHSHLYAICVKAET